MKKSFVVMVVAVLALAVSMTPANAGSQKVDLRASSGDCVPPGPQDPVAPVHGFVVLNTNGEPGGAKDFKANIQLKTGGPNSTYDVFLYQQPGDCGTGPDGTLTTNKKGHGHANLSQPRLPGPASFFIQLVRTVGSGPPVFTSDAAVLD